MHRVTTLLTVIMSGSVEEESLPAISHSEVFSTVAGGKRKQIRSRVMEQGVSLGMVDPSTGRLVRRAGGE